MISTGRHGFIPESRAYCDFTKEPWYPGFLRMMAKKGVVILPKGKSHESLNRNVGIINSTSSPSLSILPPLYQQGQGQGQGQGQQKHQQQHSVVSGRECAKDDENEDENANNVEVNK